MVPKVKTPEPETEIPETKSVHRVSESDCDEPKALENSAKGSNPVPEEDPEKPEASPATAAATKGQFSLTGVVLMMT